MLLVPLEYCQIVPGARVSHDDGSGLANPKAGLESVGQ
jgi:hypothetical protein